jgi:hypothetical protein
MEILIKEKIKKMKKGIVIILIVMMLSTMACSFTINLPTLNTGPVKTVEVKEALPTDNNEMQVELNVGAAKLNIGSGATDLVNGTIKYNVTDWKPVIDYSNDSLEISQKESNINGIPSEKMINEWDLKFTNKLPLDMTIKAGAYQGNIELGGMNISNLRVTDGASDTTLSFSKPNLGKMTKLDYSTGASSVTLNGLANANFEIMKFTAGAGTYTLNFSGELQRDADVNVEAGVSSVTIVIPEGTKAVIKVDGGMHNIDTSGTWTVDSNVYTTKGTGSTLNIDVSMSLGSLELVQK